MKKLLVMTLALASAVTMLADDYTLYIVAKTTTTSHSLATIQKLTFENGSVVVNKKDGTKDATAIGEVNRMYFDVSAERPSEDVNGDGKVDAQDIQKVYDYIQASGSEAAPAEDVNGDGCVDTQDALQIYDYIQRN